MTDAQRLGLAARRPHLLLVPRARLAKTRKSLTVFAVKIYNALPVDIKNSPSDAIFLKKIKKYLLNMAFYSTDDFFGIIKYHH